MKRLVLALFAISIWSTAVIELRADETPKANIDHRLEQAASLVEQGHHEEARKVYEALLIILRDRPPSNQLGLVLNGLGKIASASGDYKRAMQLAEQAAKTYHQLSDPDGESYSLNNQGIAEIQTGQYSTAQTTLEIALAVGRRGQSSENQVRVLNNLGSSYYYPGSYSEALHRYDEAMSLVDRNSSAKWSDYWRQITSFNQATLFQRLGRYEKALQIYRLVEQSSKSLTLSDRAHLYANLGALYRRLGDPYKALDIYREAQRLYSEQHDAGGELTVIKNIGIVYALDMENLKRAQQIFKSAISLAQKAQNRREEMQSHLYLGETLFRAQNSSAARAEFQRSKTLATELSTTEEQWKSLYGLGRIEEGVGNLADAEADYRQAIAIIEKTRKQLQLTALRSEFFADKREAYDSLIALLIAKNDITEAFSFLERSRGRNFQDRLQATGGAPGGTLSLAQAQASLPPATALLEFWTSGDRMGLIWCTASDSGLVVKRLSSEDMEQIRGFLVGMPGTLTGDWRQQIRVFDALLPSDKSFLQGIRHLLIVPDGWISYVPFDLLHAGKNSPSVLIEGYDISYMPTAAILHRPQPREKLFRFPWTRELAGFGDPTIVSEGLSESAGELENRGTQRLRFSAQEILSIADFAHGRSRVFLQQNDLKKFFVSSGVNNTFLLHVSTHAFADGDSPENSRLLFSPESPESGPDYVFLRELYELDLSNVRLATISACDSERGKIIRGEGVQAFSRALLSAGAASSLTTLWRVDDELTAEFMKQFYFQAVREHKPKAEALRLAKLKFLKSNSQLGDPRLWAAFVLTGDGATPLPWVLSWKQLVSLVCALLAALLTAVSIRLLSRSRVDREHGSCVVIT
jgi:CHAT domain-containing protein